MKDLPLFLAPNIAQEAYLPEAEAQHCVRVLRCSVGDEVLITDGRGQLYEARLSYVDKRHCAVELLRQEAWTKGWQGQITLAIAPTKSLDRIEWMLEKVTEIGIDRIILLRVKHSERKQVRADRLERILESAMKQSQKALLPELIVEQSLEEALRLTQDSLRLVAHCRGEATLGERRMMHEYYTGQGGVALFIGPEGDFTVEEVARAEEAGAHGLSLGEARLRTETAALMAVGWVHVLQEIERTKQIGIII